jgi:hypothetical protein
MPPAHKPHWGPEAASIVNFSQLELNESSPTLPPGFFELGHRDSSAMTATVVPIDCGQCEDKFFTRWKDWSSLLDGYEITVRFLCIKEDFGNIHQSLLIEQQR